MQKKNGFTLVELLVVVAILGALTALSIGAFERAREAGRKAKCMSNLRAWGIAFQAYAVDHNGLFPHPDNERRSDKSNLPESPHKHSWVDELPGRYMNDSAWKDYPPHNKPTGGFWQCPSARLAEKKTYNYDPAKNGFFSYAMNSYLAHDFPFGLDARAAQPSYLNTLACQSPAQTILLFDQHAEGYDRFGYRDTSSGYQTAGDAIALATRHRVGLNTKACNLLFLDGHVETRDNQWAKAQLKVPRDDDFTWYPYAF